MAASNTRTEVVVPSGYLRISEQAKYQRVAPRTLRRWAKQDDFPPEIELSPGSNGVRVRRVVDLDMWIESKGHHERQ